MVLGVTWCKGVQGGVGRRACSRVACGVVGVMFGVGGCDAVVLTQLTIYLGCSEMRFSRLAAIVCGHSEGDITTLDTS
jgi:hypothetical protein